MNMEQIKEVAKARGVKPGKLKKAELIRAIQAAESNPQCFGTGQVEHCGEPGCLWREDCK
ncbi:SAP domain-containing protein [Trichloromonas sp.]|uniref:SAP domain-containing protein n=1 Tax=Trichloromonas sp. TaxID=3069249 RepID=UPI002A38C834|nr:SAP domain-containing protein [Trichloromonas sp.]